MRDALAARGLHVGLVLGRLNRRKLDLLPLPGWPDPPPKSQVDATIAATEARLRGAGCAGGLADRALALQLALIEVERPAWVELETWIEPPGDALRFVRATADISLWRTVQIGRWLALAQGVTLRVGGAALPGEGEGQRRRWGWVALPQRPALFTRIVAFARGEADDDRGPASAAAVAQARSAAPAALLAAHERAWAARLGDLAIEVDGPLDDARALRFAAHHLIAAPNPDDDRVSIGARGLTGDTYHGHVFWDTEIFLLPVYALTWPEAARTLLLYRHRTLPAARAKAARLGYRGAFYAWESADTGAETTPSAASTPDGQRVPIANGTEELHIDADIARAV